MAIFELYTDMMAAGGCFVSSALNLVCSVVMGPKWLLVLRSLVIGWPIVLGMRFVIGLSGLILLWKCGFGWVLSSS